METVSARWSRPPVFDRRRATPRAPPAHVRLTPIRCPTRVRRTRRGEFEWRWGTLPDGWRAEIWLEEEQQALGGVRRSLEYRVVLPSTHCATRALKSVRARALARARRRRRLSQAHPFSSSDAPRESTRDVQRRPRFEIIAEPNRRAILSLLVSSEQSVGEIERQLRMPQPTVSKHLRVLRDAGFVESTVDAQRRLYRLKPEPLQEVDAWLAPFRRFWSAHLDALERHLDRMDQSTRTKKEDRRKR